MKSSLDLLLRDIRSIRSNPMYVVVLGRTLMYLVGVALSISPRITGLCDVPENSNNILIVLA
jgi:hypothetical protein